jgi:predicted DNA-binding transcriptional regulator AlpA
LEISKPSGGLELAGSHVQNADSQSLMDVNAIARMLSVSPATVRDWRKRGEGPLAYKIGRLVRWDRVEVQKWLAAHRERRASHKPVSVQSVTGVLHVEDR